MGAWHRDPGLPGPPRPRRGAERATVRPAGPRSAPGIPPGEGLPKVTQRSPKAGIQGGGAGHPPSQPPPATLSPQSRRASDPPQIQSNRQPHAEATAAAPKANNRPFSTFQLQKARKNPQLSSEAKHSNQAPRAALPPWVPALGDLCITVIPAPPPPSCPRKREPRVAAQSGASPITAPAPTPPTKPSRSDRGSRLVGSASPSQPRPPRRVTQTPPLAEKTAGGVPKDVGREEELLRSGSATGPRRCSPKRP